MKQNDDWTALCLDPELTGRCRKCFVLLSHLESTLCVVCSAYWSRTDGSRLPSLSESVRRNETFRSRA